MMILKKHLQYTRNFKIFSNDKTMTQILSPAEITEKVDQPGHPNDLNIADVSSSTTFKRISLTKDLLARFFSKKPTDSATVFNKKNKRFWHLPLFWCVIVPFIASCCYFGGIASDRYVSESKVIVKQSDSSSSSSFEIPLLGAGTSADMKDTQLVREFILSLDMLHYLDRTIGLRDHYQSENADFLSRLWKTDSQETFLNFYRDHLIVEYIDLSGVLSIRAQAFTPEYAQKIVEAVLEHSEEYINQISHRLAKEQVDFVRSELDRASTHLRQSKQHIRTFQEQYQLFSPEEESGAKLRVVNELEAELTRQRAALNNLRSYMNDSAADVMALNAKINSLEYQLTIERKKLVGNANNNFSDVNSQYAELLLDMEFATDLYKTSLLSLEQARIEAYRKLKHLVVVDSPSLAEEAEFPKRVHNIISIFVVLLLLHGVLRIILATIREHRDV
jgi:capsular polysaccharide transport system permease protein